MDTIEGFTLRPEDFTRVGNDLSRPECVLAFDDGTLWVSDQRSALMRIDPDGRQERVGALGGAPNGFALAPDGRFVIADIEHGRVVTMDASGRHEVLLDRFDGAPLGAANFVLAQTDGTLWVTVSTRVVPRSRAIHEPIADGYVLRIDPAGRAPVRVTGNLRFTNEIRIDSERRLLLIAETAVGAVACLSLDDAPGAPASPYGPRPIFDGAKIDGITFDIQGNLWVTEITRHAIWVIRPDGRAHEVFADPSAAVLDHPTSLTFCGPDLRSVLVGSLRSPWLTRFRAPVPGCEPVHHRWRPR